MLFVMEFNLKKELKRNTFNVVIWDQRVRIYWLKERQRRISTKAFRDS